MTAPPHRNKLAPAHRRKGHGRSEPPAVRMVLDDIVLHTVPGGFPPALVDIQTRTGLAKTTVHKAARELAKDGYLYQKEPRGRYYPRFDSHGNKLGAKAE